MARSLKPRRHMLPAMLVSVLLRWCSGMSSAVITAVALIRRSVARSSIHRGSGGSGAWSGVTSQV
jgi:hypothetical protein